MVQEDLALALLDVALAQLDVVLAQRDVVLAQLDVVLAQRDVTLALPRNIHGPGYTLSQDIQGHDKRTI